LTPDRARPYVLASEALRRLKRLPEAVDTAEQAIRLDPEQPVGYQLLAMALLAGRGRRRRAWAAAQTAVRLGPMEPAFLITCARAAAARGRRRQARRLLHD